MTDEAWAAGMARLLLTFPLSDETPEVKACRSGIYRERLDHLRDEAWAYAVDACIDHERYFPTVALLRDHAAGCPPPARAYLPTPRERADEEQMQINRRGLALIREECRKVGFILPASTWAEDDE